MLIALICKLHEVREAHSSRGQLAKTHVTFFVFMCYGVIGLVECRLDIAATTGMKLPITRSQHENL